MANKSVALVLGQNAGNKIKMGLEKDLDNYRFMVFDTLPQMLKSSKDNEQFYSKIIVFELRLTETASRTPIPLVDDEDPRVESLKNLGYYLNDNSSTEVVVVCKRDEDFTNVSDFIDSYMNIPTVTPVLPKTVTVDMFKICASGTIPEIRSRFYTQDKKKSKTRTVKQSESNEKSKPSLFGRKNKKANAPANLTGQNIEVDEPTSQNDDEFAGPAGDLGMQNTPDVTPSHTHWDATPLPASEGIAGDFSALSFGDAGSNHEETGFLSEHDEDDLPTPEPQISPSQGESRESQQFSLPVEGFDSGSTLSSSSDIFSLPSEGGSVPAMEDYSGANSSLNSFPAKYDSPQPNYDAPQPVYDTGGSFDSSFNPAGNSGGFDSNPSGGFVPSGDDGEDEVDDAPNILDRIILVTGDRGSGATTKAAELAIEAVESGSGKVLLIDIDFRKHGALGLLDDFAAFVKSGPHSIVSGKPYSENGIDILSDGYGVPLSREAIAWVEDSRNYANYSKIIIDCPLEFVSELGDFVSSVGIVYLLDGSQSGLMSTISLLDNRDAINNEVALTFRDKGLFCVIRKESNYREALHKLKGEVAIDRVDWLAKIV